MSCLDCGVELLGKQKTLCASCKRLHIEFSRECVDCYEFTIPPEASDDTTVCDGCYRNKPFRKCSECKQLTIYPKAPSWVKVCYKCSETTGKKCISEGCNKFTGEDWKDKCYSCYKK